MVKPLKVDISDQIIKDIYDKVKKYPWHEMPNDGGWEYGTNLDYMKEISKYWVSEFDWRKHEREINKFPNFITKVDDIDIHFIHEKGSGSKPMPLLISHGWPGTIVEFLHIIEKLAHPEHFGGKEEDAFDVIAPSLPGFGFSGRPPCPVGPRKMANIFNNLMTKKLGYKNYLAQGGDWGGAITTWLAYDHSKTCNAIHINIFTMRHPNGSQTKEEKDWETKFVKDQIIQDGYRTQQATKPQTLSYGMMDSPVGIAAWIIEKFYFWSDIKNNDIESVYSKDTLLANIMVYIVTKTFNTASWIYYGRREEGGRFLPKDFRRIEVPTAAALFPAEMLAWPPRSYAERMYNIKRWTKMPKGGHFAALEQPDLLVDDIRAFARTLR
ncbi:epoxide hydrolase [Marine Group I thaumarchaeote]|nr:epoxide hydrolase [Marine Group I thaumarchaeote]